MISTNEVTLAGKVTFCRYFDPGTKPYTSMWLRIATENNQSILVDVPINEKEISGRALPAIRNILEGDDAWAVVTGQIINREDKKLGKTITRLRVNLRNVEALRQEVTSENISMIAGDIEKKSSRIITIGVPYRDIKSNTWKKRKIPILLPQAGQPEFDSLHRNALTGLQSARRAVIFGKVQPKLPNGDEIVHVLATSIVPIP